MSHTVQETSLEKRLAAENRELRARLEAAEETLRAIRADEVDALVIAGGEGETVRTLQGADLAYRAFVEVMSQGAATVAADGSILYCNRHFADLLRAPIERTIGASIYAFVPAEDEGLLRALLWEGLTTSVGAKRFTLRGWDGSAVSVVLTVTPLNVGGVSCLGLALTDLTDHEARVAAEAANHAKDRFLAALSHELRTPLTPVVMTIASMEADPRIPADVREDLAMVRRNIELETRLIDDLLDVSRVISGKLRLRVAPVSIRGLFDNVLEILRSDVNQKSLDVRCRWEASADVVNGDSARLQQVIWNILKNAIKFSSERGRIDVRLTNPNDRVVRLAIRDEGAGIDPASLPRIFNAFDQGDSMASPISGGLGLGLTIAKAIVDLHGGSVRAESDGVAKGAKITVELPVVQRAVSAAAPAQVPQADRASGDGDGSGGGVRVLLVEDHVETAAILAKLLRQNGHEVTVANTLASALELASKLPLDLVISDIGLPDGTGHELMKRIRESYGLPGVALTGYGMEDDLGRSSEAGFAEHVVKPVNMSHLQSVINRVVQKARSSIAARRLSN